MVVAVGALRGALVLPVGDVERGQAHAAKEGRHAKPVLWVAVDAVDDDRPGPAAARHQPGRHRAELAVDAHRPVRKAEGAARVPGVDVGVDRDVAFGHEVPVDVDQPAGDRVLVPCQDRPGDRVPSLPGQAEDARAARFLGALEHDAVRRDRLHLHVLGPVRVIRDQHRVGVQPGREGAGEQEEDGDHAGREQHPQPATAAPRRRRGPPPAGAGGSACPGSDAADGNVPAAGPTAVSGPLPRRGAVARLAGRAGALGRLHAVLAERGEVDQQVDGVGEPSGQ